MIFHNNCNVIFFKNLITQANSNWYLGLKSIVVVNSGGICVDINECKHSKCGKGSHCVNLEGSYECECKRPDRIYDSVHKKCKKINCPQGTCSKNGKCIMEGSIFKCICKPGFTGEKCDHDINECKSNPCQHKCENTGNNWFCNQRQKQILHHYNWQIFLFLKS